MLFQWIGTKIMPRGISPLMRRRATIEPQLRGDAHQVAFARAGEQRVLRVHVDVGLGRVTGQARCIARAGHRVPLVADAAGVEHQRKLLAGRVAGCARRRCYEARLAVGVEETPVAQQPCGSRMVRNGNGPLNRLEQSS